MVSNFKDITQVYHLKSLADKNTADRTENFVPQRCVVSDGLRIHQSQQYWGWQDTWTWSIYQLRLFAKYTVIMILWLCKLRLI